MTERRVAASGALALAALMLGSSMSIASDADPTGIDAATRAQWIADHFRIEHAAELAGGVSLDAATRARWMEDHFRIEHAAELAGGVSLDAATRARWMEDHFRIEHAAELDEG